MSSSNQKEPEPAPPNPRATVSEPSPAASGAEGPADSFGEHNLSFTTTDLSLVEMTEIEYTQLQHILYSHMEAQACESEGENRLNPNSFSSSNANQTQYLSSSSSSQGGFLSNSSGSQSLCPIICQPDNSFMGPPNQCLGHIDFQELRMMLLSESSLPPNQAERTPNGSSAETSGQNVVKVKHGDSSCGMNKENVPLENPAPLPESRAKSAVRVRLEDRFNSIQAEIPRGQEGQETGMPINNVVTLIRHPSEVMGVPLHQQQNKCTTLVKNKTAATTALQFTCPLFNPSAASSATGNANSSQPQNSGPSGLEAAKHQDIGLPRAFSICYQQEIEATKQTVGPRNKAVPEHFWIKLGGETLCKQTINKRSRSRLHPLETNVQRKPLGDIQNVCDNQSTGPAQATWQTGQSTQSTQSGNQGGVSQRRERHNRMERDRRRRIRICCDELNLLVPFCTSDTDKATTLQWTTAFLKYIQERHGDSLKKEFETVFCGKTGRRLKLTRSDSIGTCPAQEITQTGASMEIK
ncbi:transcription factor-like 5 protein [Sceloporus undulatus]|uniref:transcription factor-like 5 protein n=1 Tax=Sceloporus undulatus TaxID=8520 RepID=UPI001C4CE3F6|nr:transcription factor-like 5 protein [Sceloporus undulatus]XP_042320995.1 transcription factor-like 5 protein [Sceloporus undulatus]